MEGLGHTENANPPQFLSLCLHPLTKPYLSVSCSIDIEGLLACRVVFLKRIGINICYDLIWCNTVLRIQYVCEWNILLFSSIIDILSCPYAKSMHNSRD